MLLEFPDFEAINCIITAPRGQLGFFGNVMTFDILHNASRLQLSLLLPTDSTLYYAKHT